MTVKNKAKYTIVFATILAISSCANRGGGPQGGAKDILPPVPGAMTPENGAVNVTSKKMTISFDEFVQLKSPQRNVIVSPPQKTPPSITANGKKVTIELADSLLPNTTYTIDFTNSLRDMNEGNVLENFTYSFSTGQVIDTMQISGRVLDASNLNPLVGIQVGIYAAGLSGDSTGPMYQMPMRITRTDSLGNFSIRNVKDGTYDIYALDDKNSDYILSDGEKFGFIDTHITTSVETLERYDTLKIDTVALRQNISKGKKRRKKNKTLMADSTHMKDTVVHVVYQHYMPDSIVLLSSAEPAVRQKVMKHTRKSPSEVSIIMRRKDLHRPEVMCLSDSSKSLIRKYSRTNDTISLWIPDTAMAMSDTLSFRVAYMNKDTLGNLVMEADTIKAYFNTKKAKKNKNGDKQELMHVSRIASEHPYYAPLCVLFDRPVMSLDTSKIHIQSAEDTLWIPVAVKNAALVAVDSTVAENGKYFSGCALMADWRSDQKYKVTVDSCCAVSFDGRANGKAVVNFSIKDQSEYSNLTVSLLNGGDSPVLQLLDTKDNVVMECMAQENGTKFEHLTPGDYYLRLFNDINGDGEWTPMDYKIGRQPETVQYLNQKIHLRANWDMEQLWDTQAVRLTDQKPKELVRFKTSDGH